MENQFGQITTKAYVVIGIILTILQYFLIKISYSGEWIEGDFPQSFVFSGPSLYGLIFIVIVSVLLFYFDRDTFRKKVQKLFTFLILVIFFAVFIHQFLNYPRDPLFGM